MWTSVRNLYLFHTTENQWERCDRIYVCESSQGQYVENWTQVGKSGNTEKSDKVTVV